MRSNGCSPRRSTSATVGAVTSGAYSPSHSSVPGGCSGSVGAPPRPGATSRRSTSTVCSPRCRGRGGHDGAVVCAPGSFAVDPSGAASSAGLGVDRALRRWLLCAHRWSKVLFAGWPRGGVWSCKSDGSEGGRDAAEALDHGGVIRRARVGCVGVRRRRRRRGVGHRRRRPPARPRPPTRRPRRLRRGPRRRRRIPMRRRRTPMRRPNRRSS